MTRLKLRPLALAIAAAGFAPFVAQAAPAADPQPDPQSSEQGKSDAARLGEITVTARRREENLNEIPVAVTALSEAKIEVLNIEDLGDLQGQVPNLTIYAARGSSSTVTAYIRGIGQSDPLWGVEPGVGVYIDDVYVARPQGALLDVLDVDRIEVLRGPQGTLYGRNATGGAIRYITRQPNGDPSFVVSGQFGNLGRGDLRTALGGRLGEALDFSAAALTRNRDGFSRDVTNNRDVNDQEVYAMRLGFSLPLGDSTRASLALDGIKERSGPAYATGVIRAGGTRPVSDPDNDYYTLQTNVVQGRNDLDQFGAVLTLETELDWATWRNIAHYRGMENLLFGDFDGTAQTRFHLFQDQDQDQKGYESQLISTGDGPFTWVGGVFLFRESNEQPTRQDIFATGSTNTINLDTEARALYGQGTYAFSDALRLTGGLRWSWEEKDFSVVSVRANGTPNFSFAKKDDWSKLDWRLALDYQFNDDVMGYASAATGFKSGGFNGRGASPAAITTVDEETVLAYEVGVKTTLLDDRLRFNAAYYRNQYDDLQLTAFAPDGTSLLLNAADTRIQGFEVDATAVLAPGWQVNASVGTIDAEYTDFSAINRPIFEGKELKQAPELTWTLGTQYALELGDGELVMGVQAHYTDEHFQNLANSPIIKTDEYTLVDARIAYEAAGGKWMVALWGKNLTDEEYFTGAFDLAALGFADAYMNVPRTYGIDFRYRFW